MFNFHGFGGRAADFLYSADMRSQAEKTNLLSFIHKALIWVDFLIGILQPHQMITKALQMTLALLRN